MYKVAMVVSTSVPIFGYPWGVFNFGDIHHRNIDEANCEGALTYIGPARVERGSLYTVRLSFTAGKQFYI